MALYSTVDMNTWNFTIVTMRPLSRDLANDVDTTHLRKNQEMNEVA